jgi:hypothetical protein
VCDTATGLCSNPVSVDETTCDDGNDCTRNDVCHSGVCAGEGVQSPGEVDDGVLVSQSGGISTITWNPTLGSSGFDVLRGRVRTLPVGQGGGDEVCFATGITGLATTDAAEPEPGESFWYVIRGSNACGRGSYGNQVLGGVPVPRVSMACP